MNAFEKDVVKVGHVIAWPFVHAAQVVRVIEDAMKHEPAVKAAVVGLVQQVQAVTAQGAVVVAAEGLNIPADLHELVLAKTLFAYVTSVVLPAVEGAWKDIAEDLGPVATNVPVPLPVAIVDAQAGPGLHNVTAA